MYTYDNFHRVKEEIEAKRLRARSEAEERSARLSEISPEIAAIDEELRATGMKIFRTATLTILTVLCQTSVQTRIRTKILASIMTAKS